MSSNRQGPLLLAAILGLAALPLAALPLAADPPDDLELVQVVGSTPNPVGVRHAGDGSGRLFIIDLVGRIRVYDGVNPPTMFLDIVGPVQGGGELGLLGLAFHPDYENNGFFYVNYTESTTPPNDCPNNADCNWNTVIARYSVSAGDPDVADPSSAVRLLTINQDYSNHNGGNILFGPDGYLYIGMGDGGSGGDPQNRAQSMDTLLGKMLRIDVDIDGVGDPPDCDSAGNYQVPADNPFTETAGACDEIWANGLRNPWRWSFDRYAGDMYIGDVGQNTWEEVSFEAWASEGGMNFGWRCYEGNNPFNTNGCGAPSQYDFPIIEYDQRIGVRQAVTGGYVYRGPTIGGLQGRYVYADYNSGEIWIAVPDGLGNWTSTLWEDGTLRISSFGEDENGELYVIDLGGDSIYRFNSDSSIFGDGFETMDTSIWPDVVP